MRIYSTWLFVLPARLLVLSVGLTGLLFTGCSKKDTAGDAVRPVRAIQIDASQHQVLAEYSGNIQARIESRLAFQVNGKIQARKVDVGTKVKAGQLLMQLDPVDLQLAQRQAEASLNAAKSNLELAGFELKRFQELRKTNAISQSALDAKNTAFESARATVEQAQAAVRNQSNQTLYASLVSEVDGVVTAIRAEVGQVVAAGEPVVQVAKAGELEIAVGIPENNVEMISRSTQVKIHLWANPSETISGKLRELSPVADAATRTFAAKISLQDLTPKQVQWVKLGMTASVQFAVTTSGSFVKIPLSALYQEKGVTSVWVVEQGLVKLVPVQVGGVSGNDILLTAGLTAGQTVVTAGVHVLNPGQRVLVMPPESKAASTEPFLTSQTLLAPPANVDTKGAADTKAGLETKGTLDAKGAVK